MAGSSLRKLGTSRVSAARVTKNDHSIELSYPQKRTASRVASKLRLAFGNLKGMTCLMRCSPSQPSFQRRRIEFGNLRHTLFARQVWAGDESSADLGAVPAGYHTEA